MQGHREVELNTSIDDAWKALVSPERHRWYYRLTPEGEFKQGGVIRWVDGTKTPAEESEVVEIKAPSRLVMHTRFLYAPAFAKQPQHTLTWDVTRKAKGKGCTVRMSWEAGEIVHGLLESEADNILRGLRLEHDPAAQAEIARLDSIGPIEIHDVTPDRVADYQGFFDNDAFRDFPGWQSCYCMETHRTQTDEEWAVRTAQDNRSDMSKMIKEGKVTALLAYVDGKPVGWCNYGETTRLNGLMHRFGLTASEQQGIGSLSCFVIAAPYRNHGVATRLLDVALQRLRERGVKVAEAYPVKEIKSAQSNYRGPMSMYTAAGFAPYRETEKHIIVRKNLD